LVGVSFRRMSHRQHGSVRCAVVSGAARVIRGKLTHYRQFSLIDEVREKIKAPDPGVRILDAAEAQRLLVEEIR